MIFGIGSTAGLARGHLRLFDVSSSSNSDISVLYTLLVDLQDWTLAPPFRLPDHAQGQW